MTVQTRAHIDDLYRVDGKAELVQGELVMMSPTGGDPSFAAGEVFASLREFARRTGNGRAVGDNAGFSVDLPHRESFSPDAAYYTGPNPRMKFFEGAPVFAVEIRSENDYGPAAEKKLAAKRADYFATGTEVVWDVDLLSEDVVRVYRPSTPDHPTIYRHGENAEAEPAAPGWTLPVDELFF